MTLRSILNINIFNNDIIHLHFNFTYYVGDTIYLFQNIFIKLLLVLATVTLPLNFDESQHDV